MQAPTLMDSFLFFLANCLNKPLGSTVIAEWVNSLSEDKVELTQSLGSLAHPPGMSSFEDVRKPEMERANALYPNAAVVGNNKPVVKLSNIWCLCKTVLHYLPSVA